MKISTRYIRLAKKQKRLFVIGISCGLIAGISSGFGVPFFVQHVFRAIFEATDTAYSLAYLFFISSLLPAIFLARGLFGYVNQYFLQWAMQNILQDIRQDLFNKLQILPLAYFEKRQSGDLMAKLVGDTLQVQQSVYLVARDAFVQPFTCLAGISYLIYLSVTQQQVGFLLMLLTLAPLMIVPIRYIGRNLRRRSRELQATLGELTDIMAENLRAVVEVRSFNLQAAESSRFATKLAAYNRFAMKMAKYYHMTQPFMELIAVTMVSLAFVYSYQKGVGFSAFASVGAALFFSIDAAKRMVKLLNEVQRTSGSFERIERVLIEPESIAEPIQPVVLTHPKGDLHIRDLVFAYSGDPAQPNLTIDSLHIPLGERIALVGPSGAGKSTFVKLLPRFYDLQAGSLELDGIDIRQLSKAQLRQQIAFVPQAPVLFNGTIFDNLRMARPDATEADVRKALAAAYADEFVDRLPQGLQTQVGENAIRLSGGQRQRLALARAFLKEAPILILDEATSALDAESEDKIQQALRDLGNDRTLILIAHRFATIRLAERILLFENGLIRAQGDLATLLEDDLFRKLYEMQMGPQPVTNQLPAAENS